MCDDRRQLSLLFYNSLNKFDTILSLSELYRFRKSRLNYDLIVELEEKKANRTKEDVLPPSINPQTNALIVRQFVFFSIS